MPEASRVPAKSCTSVGGAIFTSAIPTQRMVPGFAAREVFVALIALLSHIAGVRASNGRAFARVTAAHGQRRDGAVVIASACARAQRTGGVSSTERHSAGLAARDFRQSAREFRHSNLDVPHV
jgi:hypothetical protein